jgi:MFS family permease
VLQGLATGAALGAITAGLVDLTPPHRPALGALVSGAAPAAGLALGAVGAGYLVQDAAHPDAVVFSALTGAFAALALALLALPETADRRAGALASLRPRVGVPAGTRPTFLAGTPAMVATWAMGGLYLSLGPSLARDVLHDPSPATGGLVVAALTAPGALTSLATAGLRPRAALGAGALALALGTAITLAGLASASTPGFFAGTVVAGLGFGAGFSGALRSIAATAAPADRAAVFSAVYVVSYLAFSVPALLAGRVSPSAGLAATADGYGLVVGALALVALGLVLRRRPTSTPAASTAVSSPAAD